MRQQHKQFWLRRVFNSPHTLLVLLIVFIFLISIPLAKNVQKRHDVSGEIKALQQEIADNETKKSKLLDSIAYLDSKEFAEEQARLNLDLKMPGEQVVVVRNDDKGSVVGNKVTELLSKPSLRDESPARESNPRLWYKYFFY